MLKLARCPQRQHVLPTSLQDYVVGDDNDQIGEEFMSFILFTNFDPLGYGEVT